MTEERKKQRATELDIDFSLDEIDTEIIEQTIEPEDEYSELEGELSPEELKAQRIKKLVMGGIALLLVGGLVWFFIVSEPAEEVEDLETPALVEENDVPVDKPKREKYVPPPSYTVEPFFLSDNSKGAKKGNFLQVSFQFLLSNESIGKDLDRNNTELRKNIYTVLRTKGVNDIRNPKRRKKLEQELIIAANRVLQRGTVYEVYITSYTVR